MENQSIRRIAENSMSMSLDHNLHKTFYESVHEYLDARTKEADSSVDEEIPEQDLREMVETDTIWEPRWYATSPVGFNVVYAPSLERAIDRANEHTSPTSE